MTFNDILKESWLSISGNKIRSFLTVLGIVIGVMAVVIMVAVGETVQKEITGQFSSLGTNTIMIRAGAAQQAGVRTGSRQTLTIDDAEFIAKLPDVAAISPVQSGSAQVVYGNKNWATSMMGVLTPVLEESKPSLCASPTYTFSIIPPRRGRASPPS